MRRLLAQPRGKQWLALLSCGLAAVVLNKFEDMNYAEIAEVMGLTTKAVKSLLSRARENLRLALKQYIYMEGEVPDNGEAEA